MKKKINKDYKNHWLYSFIGSYAMNFEGMSFPRLFQLLCSLSPHIGKDSLIRLTEFIPIPLGNNTFSITCNIYYYYELDVQKFQIVTTYPMKKRTLSKYGSLSIDNKGFYRFIPHRLWSIK